MQIKIMLDELMPGKTSKEMAAMIGVGERLLKKLRQDGSWRLEKHQLRKLMLYAFNTGHHLSEIFQLQAHPLWRNLEGHPITIFRVDRDWDAQVEAHLQTFLRNLMLDGSPVKVEQASYEDVDKIAKAMKENNCIFLGSPKSNIATEIALALMWDAKPFNADPANRKKIPVRFLGMERDLPEIDSAVLENSNQHGLLLNLFNEPMLVEVDWFPPKDFQKLTFQGYDASLVVAQRKPLSTQNDVTSIVIGGYTGRATYLAARDLTHENHGIDGETLESSTSPIIAVYRYLYDKRRSPDGRLDHLRKEVPGEAAWAPPWSEVLTEK